jgi:hypothetical protein
MRRRSTWDAWRSSLANSIALRTPKERRPVLQSLAPMPALTVGHTIGGRWIMARPIVEMAAQGQNR